MDTFTPATQPTYDTLPITSNAKRTFSVRCLILLDASAGVESIAALHQAITHIAPVAMEVDDNSEVPVFLFGDAGAVAIRPMLNANNLADYVKDQIEPQAPEFASSITKFNSAFMELLDGEGFVKSSLFGEQIVRHPNREATLVFLCSSREPEDAKAMEESLIRLESSSSWVYTNFIAIGQSGSNFALQKMWAQKYANVGFLNLCDVKGAAHSKIHSRLIHTELEKWVNTQTGVNTISSAQVASSASNALPDRLSTEPSSPHYNEAVLSRPIGIRFNGVEKTNVEEYCVSEGWIKVPAGKSLDRKGRALLLKIKGKVEAYYRP